MRRIRGGDATQNGDFPLRKQRLQGSKIFSDLILSKERIFRGRCDRKWRFSKEETAFAGVQKFSDFILSTQRIDAVVQNC